MKTAPNYLLIDTYDHVAKMIGCGLWTGSLPATFTDSHTTTQTRWMADPDKSAQWYVWLHIDDQGVPFYVGRGRNDSAWTIHGGFAWEWFVRNKLGGEYRVAMLAHSIDEKRSQQLREAALEHYGLQLLNAANYARGMNFQALEEYRSIKTQLKPFYQLVKSESDYEVQYKLASEALEIQYRLFKVSLLTETGRFGRVIFEANPTAELSEYFLQYVVKHLVATRQLACATAALTRHYGFLEGCGIPIPVSTLYKIISRGTYKRRPRTDQVG